MIPGELSLHPEIEPYDHGVLAAGDGNVLYRETCGSPGGKPAVVLHGGSGSGCSTRMRRYFDPAAWPGAKLVVDDASHSLGHQGMTGAVVAALDGFGR